MLVENLQRIIKRGARESIEKVAIPHTVLAYNDDVGAERNVEIFEISEIAYGDACEVHFHILDGDAVANWKVLLKHPDP